LALRLSAVIAGSRDDDQVCEQRCALIFVSSVGSILKTMARETAFRDFVERE
jgi:hypothetical protein